MDFLCYYRVEPIFKTLNSWYLGCFRCNVAYSELHIYRRLGTTCYPIFKVQVLLKMGPVTTNVRCVTSQKNEILIYTAVKPKTQSSHLGKI